MKYEIAGEFLADIKKALVGGVKEMIKVVELKMLKQGSKTMEEFVQKFRRAARKSGYEGLL